MLNEFKVVCSNCNGIHIKLMADFCSTGIWCAQCGVMLSYNQTNLPEELTKEIQSWNNLYDDYISDKEDNNTDDVDYRVPKGFNEQGLKIAMKIQKYHPCLLFIDDEDE